MSSESSTSESGTGGVARALTILFMPESAHGPTNQCIGLGTVLRERPDLAAAGTFYLIYGVGMAPLVVAPALRERSVLSAAWRGAVLGLTAYATFDLTNLAIVRDWTLTVSLADMAWGTCATGLACLAGYGAGHWATRTDGDRL